MRTNHPSEPQFECNVCKRWYHTSVGLSNHSRRHREPTLKCPQCPMLFHTKATLDPHIREHLGEEPYVCPNCPEQYNTRRELHLHQQSHHTPEGIQRHKREEQRIERALLAHGYSKAEHNDGTLPPPRSFTREHRVDFRCLEEPTAEGEHWAFIDFVISLPNGGICFLEVDEHQHKYGYSAKKSCDMKRMNRVEASRTLEHLSHHPDLAAMPKSMWLRYNPHEYSQNGKVISPTKRDNERRLCAYLDAIVIGEECGDSTMCIRYMNYDTSDDVPLCTQHPEYHPQLKHVASATKQN